MCTWIDPRIIHFTHARISPHFSGCGRSVIDTLEELKMGYITPAELPRIKVVPLVPQDDAEFLQQRKVNKRAAAAAAVNALTYYFSLNNRRLWVLKQCRELGLLHENDHKILVVLDLRKQMREKYTIDRCSLSAKFMTVKSATGSKTEDGAAQKTDGEYQTDPPDDLPPNSSSGIPLEGVGGATRPSLCKGSSDVASLASAIALGVGLVSAMEERQIEGESCAIEGLLKTQGTTPPALKLTWEGPSDINNIHFSPNGKSLLVGMSDGTLRILDATNATLIHTEATVHEVTMCSFAPDGRTFFGASPGGAIRTWSSEGVQWSDTGSDASNRTQLHSCCFSPGGNLILGSSSDGRLTLWRKNAAPIIQVDDSVKLNKCLWQKEDTSFDGVSGAAAYTCAFSPDGKTVLSGSKDKTLRLWCIESKGLLKTLDGGHSGEVTCCEFSPCGTKILSGSEDSTLVLWDIASEKAEITMNGHCELVLTCCFSPDGKLIASGSVDNTLKLWDASSGKLRASLQHFSWVKTCKFSPDGKAVVSGGVDTLLRWWG